MPAFTNALTRFGQVLNDLTVRRGQIIDIDTESTGNMGTTAINNSQRNIRSEVPLEQLGDYSTVLRSLTAGGGDFAMAFVHYRAC